MKSFEIMKVLYLKFWEERTLMVKGKTAISILNKETAGEISARRQGWDSIVQDIGYGPYRVTLLVTQEQTQQVEVTDGIFGLSVMMSFQHSEISGWGFDAHKGVKCLFLEALNMPQSTPLCHDGVEKLQASSGHLDQMSFKVLNNPGNMCLVDYNDSGMLSFSAPVILSFFLFVSES